MRFAGNMSLIVAFLVSRRRSRDRSRRYFFDNKRDMHARYTDLKNYVSLTYFTRPVSHENSPPRPIISLYVRYPNDIRILYAHITCGYPCYPMLHHHASKLVFRLSIAHYLLSVTKITSLTFSLSPGRSRWRLRVHARARAHAYQAFS